eukprot:IDg21897t1
MNASISAAPNSSSGSCCAAASRKPATRRTISFRGGADFRAVLNGAANDSINNCVLRWRAAARSRTAFFSVSDAADPTASAVCFASPDRRLRARGLRLTAPLVAPGNTFITELIGACHKFNWYDVSVGVVVVHSSRRRRVVGSGDALHNFGLIAPD